MKRTMSSEDSEHQVQDTLHTEVKAVDSTVVKKVGKKARKQAQIQANLTATSVSNTITANATDNNNKMMITCTHCQQASFPSRNKLFAHLKICQIDRNPAKRVVITEEDFHTTHQAYIYVTGGRVRGKTLITAERFNCRTQCWEMIPHMAEHRGSHGSAVVQGQLYVMGGGGLHSNLNSVEKFDTMTNTWSIVSQMQTFRHALSVISTENDDLYAIGGWYDGSVCSVDNERYDIASNTWTKCSNMPTGRRLLGVTYYQQKIYCFGGNCGDKVWNTDVLEIYDIATNTWSTGKSLPIAGQCSAVTIGDFIYVVLHGNYILRYDPRTNDYVQICDSLPCKQWFCFDVTVINDRMYFHGGNEDGIWSNAFWKYDVFTNTWTQLPSMHKERRRCSAAVVIL